MNPPARRAPSWPATPISLVGPLVGPLVLAPVLALVLALVLPSTGAAAQQGPVASSDGISLTLTAMTGILGPGSVPPTDVVDQQLPPALDLRLRALVANEGSNALDSLQFVVEIHPPTLTRGMLRQALNGDLRTDALHVHTQQLAEGGRVAPGDVIGITDEFERAEVDWATGPGGVHPVRLAVVRGTTVLSELVTAVVWVTEYPSDPMYTLTAWPLTGAPWRGPGGAYAEGVDRAARTGGRIDALVRALEQTPQARVSPLVPAHLLEDLADRADGFHVLQRGDAGTIEPHRISADEPDAQQATALLRRLRELVATTASPPIAGAYADADLPALLAGDATSQDLAALSASEGRRRLQLQVGREVDGSTTLLDGPVDAASLDLVPSEAVLLPYHATTGPPLGPDPAIPEPVRSVRAPSGRLLTALVGDPYLEEALAAATGPAGPVPAAQRVLAESAMAYFTAPNQAGRSLVVLPPAGWAPSTRVAAAVLDAIDDAVWLRAVTPATLVSTGRRAPAPVELAPDALGPFPAGVGSELSSVWRKLDAVEAALPPGISRIGDRPLSELRDDVLRSATVWERGGEAPDATARLREANRAADGTFGALAVIAGNVTLTSTTGQVPVTIQRLEGGPISVTVEVLSQGRLQWPDGRRSEPLTIDAGETQTITFATEAVSTGTFPVTVRVTDPTGSYELASGSLSVRSTAISTTALLVIGLLVLVLLLFGALRRRDRDRDRAPQLVALLDPTPPSDTAGGDAANDAGDDDRSDGPGRRARAGRS